jgi:hypothetical protein
MSATARIAVWRRTLADAMNGLSGPPSPTSPIQRLLRCFVKRRRACCASCAKEYLVRQRKYRLNWSHVKDAVKRSRYGKASEDDRLLCEYAFKKDPDRYKKLREEVVQQVFAEVSMRTSPNDPQD